jgi:beta-galactosidase
MNKMIIVCLVLLIILLVNTPSFGIPDNKTDKGKSNSLNKRQFLINDSWQYLEDPIVDVRDLVKSKMAWTTVNIPHSWNAFDAVDQVPGYRRSASWYKKNINIPISAKDSRIIIYFEGINTESKVFVNNKFAGGHVGGYIGFEIDITPFIKYGSNNLIAVRADNSINFDIIPSQKSDFFIYGGITRNVWIKAVPHEYIKTITIHAADISKDKAKTSVEVKIINTLKTNRSSTIEAILKEATGRNISQVFVEKTIQPGTNNINLEFPILNNPQLWSPSNPYLYSVNVRLKDNNKITDTVTEKFGYRFFEFKEHGPFFLNGERLLLRGTQRHEDYAGLANALPDSLQRKDMEMIKGMGANFVRLAHYPQAPEVYRACDELGILVWDELPWCRGGIGGAEWKKNTRRMLEELIEQNYNHPSIIMWSLGNEVNWESDFEDGDNPDSLRSFFTVLNDEAHKLDPSRITAARKSPEGAEVVDVFSPSIWSGWYSSNYFNYEKTITEARDQYKRFFHAEYGGDSHVGRHTENPVGGDGYIPPSGWDTTAAKVRVKNISLSGDWSESYIVNLFDWYLHISEQLDWFTGSAQWIFKDFGTPLRPENPIPYINQKGLVNRAGKPKDAYYVYKSYWTTDPKFCYIESHTWTDRNGPKNLKRQVKVYSNCDEVELFINGVSQGKNKRDIKDFPACGLHWSVNFTEGKNSIRAIGYKDGRNITEDSMTVNYWFKKNQQSDNAELSSSKIEFSYSKMDNGNILVTALAVDKNGKRFLEYNKRVYFTYEGQGKLLENYGIPTRSSIIEMANGKAQIEVQPANEGSIIIEARTQEFKGAYLKINWSK